MTPTFKRMKAPFCKNEAQMAWRDANTLNRFVGFLDRRRVAIRAAARRYYRTTPPYSLVGR